MIDKLLEKGLNLNQKFANGTLAFTWFIGNAQNSLVNKLLTSAEINQKLDQRLTWINEKDSMIRLESIEDAALSLCFGLFENEPIISIVAQTPLQLVIAKGYTNASGSNMPLCVSNLQIAEQLLRLGADKEINYQEPSQGNTALHIAYARRDCAAIKLLQNNYGASQYVRNNDGKLPKDMLSLSYNQVAELMVFHTSPDGHPNTYRLNQEEFDDALNLKRIKNGINLERQFIAVNGKEVHYPENSFCFNRIEIAAIDGEYDEVSCLVSQGINPKIVMESIQYRIQLAQFIRDDNPLHLQHRSWSNYAKQRQQLEDKYNVEFNPYMVNLTEEGFTSYQSYVENNRDEASS